MKKFSYVAVLAAAFPLGASAAINNLNDIFTFARNILNAILPLFIAAAVVYFVYGMLSLFWAGDDDKKKKAKDTIIYGVIAIFVMVSIWGLVNILVNTFGLNNNNTANGTVQNELPQFNTNVQP